MGETATSIAEALLRENGLRVTAPRRAVLDFLKRSVDHPTAEEIGRGVNRRSLRASRASVYNVLRSLKLAGLVRELVFDDTVSRYDANLSAHDHFVCRVCGAVEDLASLGPRPALPRSVRPGTRVEEAVVTYRGLCAACPNPFPSRPQHGSQE